MDETMDAGRLPTLKELQESAKNSRCFHFVGLLNPPQPGVRLLFARLKHEHYPPGTSHYNLLRAAIIEWNGKDWMMVSVPRQDTHLVQQIALQCGLQVVQGAPMMGGAEGLEQFPISGNGDNVFTLLNPPDHSLFHGKLKEIRDLLYKESLHVMVLNQHWDCRN